MHLGLIINYQPMVEWGVAVTEQKSTLPCLKTLIFKFSLVTFARKPNPIMKKILALALVLGGILSFTSCKKCYNCNKMEYQYCSEVTVTTPFGGNTFNQCFSDSNQRNGFVSSVEGGVSSVPGGSASHVNSDTLINNLNQEVCGGNKTLVENDVKLWENDGYTCTEK